MVKEWYYNSRKVRYIRTYKDWSLHKASKLISKYSILLLLLYILIIPLAFLIYSTPNPWNEEFVKGFAWLNHLTNVYDSDVRKIIVTIISSLTIILSLISAIYVFTYREQKSVAPSATTNSKRNKWVMLVIFCMIFNITFGSLLVSKYSKLMEIDGYKESLSVTKQVFSGNLLMLCTILLLVYLIIRLVKHLFKTMSVNKMLQDSVKDTSELFDKIVYADTNSQFDELLEEWYKKLHYSLESVFQNFKFAAENNMNKEFQDNLDQFEKLVIEKFKQDTKRYEIGFVHSYLINKDGNQFLEAYRSALRSNFSLITSLMKNQQYNKGHDLVNLYFKMYIPEEQFVRLFQNNLALYIDTIDTSDEKQLSIFLKGISSIPKEQTLFVYKYLIMKLITKNQLINLTNTVYALKDYLEDRTLKNSTIIILLQNLIKSIEISNDPIAGFLVKFLVTNISGKDINRGLRILKVRPTAFTSIWEEQQEKQDEDSFKGINEHPDYPIKINDKTFNYCYKKAFILLFGQHVYSIRKKLWYVEDRHEKGNEMQLAFEFKTCPYSEYILTRTKAASSKYGLIFFEDNEIMEIINKELNLKILNSEKDKSQSFPQLISSLINKFL